MAFPHLSRQSPYFSALTKGTGSFFESLFANMALILLLYRGDGFLVAIPKKQSSALGKFPIHQYYDHSTAYAIDCTTSRTTISGTCCHFRFQIFIKDNRCFFSFSPSKHLKHWAPLLLSSIISILFNYFRSFKDSAYRILSKYCVFTLESCNFSEPSQIFN